MKLPVTLERDESGMIVAECPAIPGCVSQGQTEEEALARERGEELLRHLDALPYKLREAVALRHVLGLSERETADALGVRPGTVKSRVSRGLERLRESMGGAWE